MLDTIEREKITEMTGVPAMYQMMLQSPTIDRRNLSSLRYCGYGGAPAPVELIKTLKKKFFHLAATECVRPDRSFFLGIHATP
jgi:long-chain acyl-CoA synthetase